MTGKVVLIVDDDPSIAESCRYSLECDGFGVVVASDGALAIEALSQQAFDLVLSDWMMPKVDGVELWQWINLNRRGLPFILATSMPEPPGAMQHVPFLRKPFTPELLSQTVEMAIRQTGP